MHHRRMDRQTAGQMNRTDFIGPLERWRFDRVFRKFENKIFLNYWLDCEPYGKNQCRKKEYNHHSLGFKEFKNNDP